MDHRGRQKSLKESLVRNRLDALLIAHLPNIRYLCGFSGSAGAVLLSAAKSVLFTDGRYTAQARAEVQGARIVISRKAPHTAAAQWLTANRRSLGSKGPWRVGIEGEHLTVAARSRLADILSSKFRLREAPALVEQARIVKDAEEIERIRTAVALGASLFDQAVQAIRPGVRETEVAAEMEYAARRAGAEEMSFPTIIASGSRSAQPHGRASGATIPGEGFVVCDFGVILAGYCSDMTRTVYVGRPTAEARRFYQAVREAQQAAIETVKPGVSVGEVDQAARKLLRKQGLGKHFTHSTGHGVGLEIHEAPRLAAGQGEALRPGMVITIEPGAYIPGKWGVRIEDMVLVTERGYEVLTPASKELIAV
ncbi:MAG: peptidase M24 family protein [Acidobacteria bacterium 13_1_40CM_4_58_4]|nr:MAG: peptidase M24 family protein [Acidobacteria bacterium 13_1_40CM_4_58_4]